MMLKLTGFLFLACTLLATACSVNPVTGESQLYLVSTGQEVAIGEQNYGPMQQAQGAQYTLDPAVHLSAWARKL